MDETGRVLEAAALHAFVTARPKGRTIPVAVAQALQLGREELLAGLPRDLLGESHVYGESLSKVRGWLARGIDFVSIREKEYPSTLRNVHDAPPFLFYRGDLKLASRGGMSIVGTREITPRGAEMARLAAATLTREEIPIISGLARGVDQAAHTTALELGGDAIGVIATSILGPYTPSATRGIHEQIASSGLLVSQFDPDLQTNKGNFLRRNATMSGMGIGTIIIEAHEHSGTRGQARNALDHGRPVILTHWVVDGTTWARELVHDKRRNVLVISSPSELIQAVKIAREIESPGVRA